jgi:type 2A phosphatase activator TIP41
MSFASISKMLLSDMSQDSTNLITTHTRTTYVVKKMETMEREGWRFESKSGPILNTGELDALSAKLKKACEAEGLPSTLPPLPEAIFGHNCLTLTHEASGHVLRFDAEGAIMCWLRSSAHKGSGGLRVRTANTQAWQKHLLKLAEEQGDHDWTFSTDYSGTTNGLTRGPPAGVGDARTARQAQPDVGCDTGRPSFIESHFSSKVEYEAWLCATGGTPDAQQEGSTREGPPKPVWREHTGSGLDMELLRRRDVPILHFEDFPLYEDDLHDFGDSVVRVRLRVMPSCFFVLLRHSLRVDGLLIRQHDTRLFHKFGTPHLLRARRLGEASLEPIPKVKLSDAPDPPNAARPNAAPWAATMAPLGSALLPDEQKAAERLAMLPPVSESVDELLLV